MASNTPSPDPRPLSLPAWQFDDCLDLLDGVCATLNRLEQQLRDHFATQTPVMPAALLGLLRVGNATLGVVSDNLLDAEAAKLPDEAEEGVE